MAPVTGLRTVLSAELIAAFAFLLLGGPVLVFPDLLPVASRTTVVTLLTLVVLGVALRMLHPWKTLRPGLGLFLLAVVASWAWMPFHDSVSVRHFAGIGVGVLAMAVVATWCTTTARLIDVTRLFAVGSTGVLVVGLLSTFVNNNKVIGVARLVPNTLFNLLPGFQLGLSGLEADGLVNSNALGGTALMVLPTCGGLAAAALVGDRSRRLTLAVGAVATTVPVGVLGMTLSVTAWIGALLTLLVLSLCWRRGRRWVLPALVLGAASLAYKADQSRAPISALKRWPIWQEGINRLQEAPWLGVGISEFHPHAHNVLLQVALDVGVLGLCGYVLLISTLALTAYRTAHTSTIAGRIAAGSGLSLVGVHFFGLGDAIALGAKVGLFQWLCAGLILAASRLPPAPAEASASTSFDPQADEHG